MKLEVLTSRLFAMSDAIWARHANPWSVWTRNSCLPLLALACWSRVWLGWGAWGAVALALAWTWLNPRVFPPPRSTDNWASRGVLGERVWLNRKRVPVPAHHVRAATVLALVSTSGLPFVIWGAVQLAVWPALLGLVLIHLGKLWFMDRMVWLYADMQNATPEYRSWVY